MMANFRFHHYFENSNQTNLPTPTIIQTTKRDQKEITIDAAQEMTYHKHIVWEKKSWYSGGCMTKILIKVLADFNKS